MLSGMSAPEYVQWKAFWELDPPGDQRADLRMAKIMSAVLAPHMNEPPSPADLMPFPDDAHEISDQIIDEHERAMMLKIKRIAG